MLKTIYKNDTMSSRKRLHNSSNHLIPIKQLCIMMTFIGHFLCIKHSSKHVKYNNTFTRVSSI